MVEEHKDLGDVAAAQMDRNGRIGQIGVDWRLGSLGVDLGQKYLLKNREKMGLPTLKIQPGMNL